MAVQEQKTTKSGLVLDSLEVKNFRAFKHLTIEKLGRVNLITGKNNVGKTSLLEAIWVYLNYPSSRVMYELLHSRDEIADLLRFSVPFGFSSDSERLPNPFTLESEPGWTPYLASLFHNRNDIYHYSGPFEIHDRSGLKDLRFDLTFRDSTTKLPTSYLEPAEKLMLAEPVIFITYLGHTETLALDDYVRAQVLFGGGEKRTNTEFVSSNGVSRTDLARLWDAVALTDAETDVLSLLRLVDSRIERLAFRALNKSSYLRVPYVKMADSAAPIPLRRLGDGVNRLLGIALSMSNCNDGVLLLDEIENGLHYSVLPSIWTKLFEMATTSNVQVFAATHSWECIEAFQEAAGEDDNPTSGLLVRLQNKNSNVIATVFDEDELATITRSGIEVR